MPEQTQIAELLELARVSGANNLASKYQVLRPLGVGGVGFVVAARHVGFDAEVALKFLHPKYAADPACTSRFLSEARAQFRIRSPHVARVLNVEQPESGPPFIVLELLRGTDLRSLLEAEPRLDVQRACRHALQICSGLAAAHALGIVHCDLKPENLFVGPGGIKILDFGIAQLRGRNTHEPMVAIGTPAYMAPEQLHGERADARTDLWALGCVLYEMLAGESPFARDTQELTCSAVLHETPVPLVERNPEVPLALSQLVMRCLARSPARRFQHAQELAQAIELARATRVSTAVSVPRTAPARLGPTSMKLLAAIACCALALAWAVHARRGHAPRPIVVSSVARAPAATTWVDSALMDAPEPSVPDSEAQGWSSPAAAKRARGPTPTRRPRAAREQTASPRREPTAEPDVGF